jgi:hypothetical protein
VAALGLLGTLGGTVTGVVITQARSDKRDALNWERQRQREHEAWQREDAARTFEHRREVYGAFYESLRETSLRVYNHGMGLTDEERSELPFDWQLPLFERLLRLNLYATSSVRDAAQGAYSGVYRWGAATRLAADDDDFYANQEAADEAEDEFLNAIRADLLIPDA